MDKIYFVSDFLESNSSTEDSIKYLQTLISDRVQSIIETERVSAQNLDLS